MNVRSIIFILCISSLTVANLHATSYSKDLKGNAIESNEQKDLFEFKFTDEELIELSKWKNKSFDDMWNDAFDCDRAALYMIGMSFLTGSADLTIDVQQADLHFSKSASFGFAPALKQLIHKNIEEENIFLVLVYSNLMTSLGHSEYVIPYHELRTKAMATFGNGISNEIDKIASSKKELIFRTVEKLKISENRKFFFLEMKYDGSLIDHQDRELNYKYWMQFTKFQSDAEDEAKKFQTILNYDFHEFKQHYEKSKANLSIVINKLRNDESINKFQIDFLKDAKKAIGKTEEFIDLMEGFQNVSNQNLRKLAKEFLLLSKNAKGVLEQHCKFFLSPNEFLESDESMNKFTEYNAGVKEHSENIEEFLKQFK